MKTLYLIIALISFKCFAAEEQRASLVFNRDIALTRNLIDEEKNNFWVFDFMKEKHWLRSFGETIALKHPDCQILFVTKQKADELSLLRDTVIDGVVKKKIYYNGDGTFNFQEFTFVSVSEDKEVLSVQCKSNEENDDVKKFTRVINKYVTVELK